jgi:NTE family protein
MRGLVLPGGGSRGSWQAGALLYMGESGRFDDGFQFGSGTSVGAINISGVGMFPPEKFPEAAAFIAKMWREDIQKTSDVWSLRFPVGVPALWKPSVGTATALDAFLEKHVDIAAIQKSGVQIRYTAADVETGELVIYSGEDLLEHGVKPIAASASYPMAFPPVEIQQYWLTDGGVRETAPLSAAIKAGCDEIVVIPTRDPHIVERRSRSEINNALEFGQRCLSIQFHEVLQNDLKACRQHNHWSKLPEVLRARGVPEETIEAVCAELKPRKHIDLTVIYPSKPLGTSLDFSGDLMKKQLEQGYEDARSLFEG